GAAKTIRTIFPVTETEKENRCFLVGLDEKTPLYYSLMSSDENNDEYRLVYRGENDECAIQKTFVINKRAPKIDLVCDVIIPTGKDVTVIPRIFFPAPLMPDIRDNDVISSVVIDQT